MSDAAAYRLLADAVLDDWRTPDAPVGIPERCRVLVGLGLLDPADAAAFTASAAAHARRPAPRDDLRPAALRLLATLGDDGGGWREWGVREMLVETGALRRDDVDPPPPAPPWPPVAFLPEPHAGRLAVLAAEGVGPTLHLDLLIAPLPGAAPPIDGLPHPERAWVELSGPGGERLGRARLDDVEGCPQSASLGIGCRDLDVPSVELRWRDQAVVLRRAV